MTIDEAIKRYVDNAEYERTHGNLQGCLEFKQLAKWLKELKQLREQTEWIPCDVGLPKQNEYIGNVCKYYLVQDCYGDMYVARYTKKGWNPIDSLFFLDDVVAWRQLPEKYKGDKND